MGNPKETAALTDDVAAPVLSDDQAEPLDAADAPARTIDLPLEENDFNAQPG